MTDASDNVVGIYEVPGAIIDSTGKALPRSDPKVQAVFNQRRPLAQRALAAFQAAQKAQAVTPQP